MTRELVIADPITPTALAEKREALELTASIVVVTNEAERNEAVAAASLAKALSKGMERTREEFKAPILEAGRLIDSTAKGYQKELDAETARLERLAAAYTAKKLSEAAERQRAEQDRIRKEREAAMVDVERARAYLAKQEEEYQAKRRRNISDMEALEQANDWKGVELLQCEMDDHADAHAENVRLVDAEIRKQEAAQLDREREAVTTLATFAPAKVSGARTTTIRDYRVTNALALATARPDLVDIQPRRSLILASISIPGHPPIAGIEEFDDTKVHVR